MDTKLTPIGFVLRYKGAPNQYVGRTCFAHVYTTRSKAIAAQRSRYIREPAPDRPHGFRYRSETDEEFLARFDILEVFVKEPA